MHFTSLLIMLAGSVMPTSSAPTPNSTTQNLSNPRHSTTKILASPDVDWKPCPKIFQMLGNVTCMRLEVPLDYENHQAGTTAIAFMKIPATNPSSETRDILMNPGGPGGSGINSVMPLTGMDLRPYLGSENNIVAFDPRGVGQSGPNVDCYRGDKVAQYQGDTTMYSNLSTTFEHTGYWGEVCAENLNSTARYIGTAAVARDMLTFVEKQAIADGKPPEDAVLNYYGVSYGTVLGSTFATLFPSRVGRMALDSVVGGEYYYSGNSQDSLLDADEVVRQFFRQCFEAGPERCQFWALSPREIETRYENLLAMLDHDPIHVPYTDVAIDSPIFVTSRFVRGLTLRYAYGGHSEFPGLAGHLADIEARKISKELLGRFPAPSCIECNKDDWSTLARTFVLGQNRVFESIKCVDADGRYDLPTHLAFNQHIASSVSMSRYDGDLLGVYAGACRKWPFLPPQSQKFDGKIGANTSHPLLILSNTFDTATPVVHARKLETQFLGSVLLEQDAVGHGVLPIPSNCTSGHLRRYFETGELPSRRTICLPNDKPALVLG